LRIAADMWRYITDKITDVIFIQLLDSLFFTVLVSKANFHSKPKSGDLKIK